MKRTISLTETTAILVLGWLVSLTLAANSGLAAQADLVVAADGSGRFKTVQEAINAAPAGSPANPSVIRIKPGIYKEQIHVPREKRFVSLVGEDANKTVLTYDLLANALGQDGKPLGTFRTPSTRIDADDFTAENITFENSAGTAAQALAIAINGDRVVFRNCRFLGWQDTILANRGRHYFENCYIAGHYDFIFGAATAFFQNCHIHCLRDGYITAASTPANQPFGFIFSNCTITGEAPDVMTYLGRPWRSHANVIFLNTKMSEVVRSIGWNNWEQPDREKTARYAEFNSTGPGANPQARAAWSRQLTNAEARAITLEKVLGGSDRWNPKLGDTAPRRGQSLNAGKPRHHGRYTTRRTQASLLKGATQSRYKEGQIWSYQTRPGEEKSYFQVVKVTHHPKLGNVIHVAVRGLKMKNPLSRDGISGGVRNIPFFSDRVRHLPFVEKAIDKSAVKLLKEKAALPDYEEDYGKWRDAFDAGRAGVYTITLAEAVDRVEASLNQEYAAPNK